MSRPDLCTGASGFEKKTVLGFHDRAIFLDKHTRAQEPRKRLPGLDHVYPKATRDPFRVRFKSLGRGQIRKRDHVPVVEDPDPVYFSRHVKVLGHKSMK